jgi:hypothetical protein
MAAIMALKDCSGGREEVPRAAFRAGGLPRLRPGGRPSRSRGFIMLDAIASLALAALLVIAMATSVGQFNEAARESDTRRMLRLAAEAELNRVRAGLPAAATSAPAEPATDNLTIAATSAPGHDAWSGFTLVRVIARRPMQGARVMQVELSAYLPTAELPALPATPHPQTQPAAESPAPPAPQPETQPTEMAALPARQPETLP